MHELDVYFNGRTLTQDDTHYTSFSLEKITLTLASNDHYVWD